MNIESQGPRPVTWPSARALITWLTLLDSWNPTALGTHTFGVFDAIGKLQPKMFTVLSPGSHQKARCLPKKHRLEGRQEHRPTFSPKKVQNRSRRGSLLDRHPKKGNLNRFGLVSLGFPFGLESPKNRKTGTLQRTHNFPVQCPTAPGTGPAQGAIWLGYRDAELNRPRVSNGRGRGEFCFGVPSL